MCKVYDNASGELKCFCTIVVYYYIFNYTDWQDIVNSQCPKQSMYYQIRLHVQQGDDL